MELLFETAKLKFTRIINQLAENSVEKCYLCGKCTAGCPMAYEMDIQIHQIMRFLKLGEEKVLLKSRAIWQCVGCQTCSSRCPKEVDPASFVDALRVYATLTKQKASERAVEQFNYIFLEIIRHLGRIYEVGLVGLLNIFYMQPFRDIALAPKMVIGGKLNFIPHKIKGSKEIKRIFLACEELAQKDLKAKKELIEKEFQTTF